MAVQLLQKRKARNTQRAIPVPQKRGYDTEEDEYGDTATVEYSQNAKDKCV